MKLNFKKISAITTSVLMAGLTLGAASAASFPAPFVVNEAANNARIVYGSGLDVAAATSIQTYLGTQVTGTGAIQAGDVQVSENEIALGGSIAASGDIDSVIKDNKLSTLADDKLSWDDGTGSEDYDFHEELNINDMNVYTTIDDEKLDGVALSNEKGLEYKLILEDHLNLSAIGTDEADDLYLDIMGKEYEIEGATDDSLSVVTSDEVSMSIGETYTVAGKVVTLVDVFDGSVEVSVDGTNEAINLGSTEKVNGIRVKVKTIGYHSNTPETSRAVIRVGEDISKTFEDGSEFIGQDEDDPLWTWHISGLDNDGGIIGVKYNADIDSANDEIAGDSIKYIGEGYVFPNDYAAVTLDSTTDAVYQDLKIYFEDAENLFNNSDGSTAMVEDAKVLVIESDATDDITVNTLETDKVYVYYNTTDATFQTFYKDNDGEYTPTNYMRYAGASGSVTGANLATEELLTIEYGDTNLGVSVNVTDGIASLTVNNKELANSSLVLTLGGDIINDSVSSGTIEGLGATLEDAEDSDIIFATEDVSTSEYELMDHYGIYLAKGDTVKSQADSDEVTLSVPEEQVYAKATVSMGATVATSDTLGNILVTDSEIENVKDNNLIIVGGSCVNAAAATVLGGNWCGADFTDNTGVGVGEFLIKGVQDAFTTGKLALVVAGYEAADTTAAATYLTMKDVDTSKTYKGTTITNTAIEVTTA